MPMPMSGGKGVGDVLDEDEAQHKVLVFGSVHVGAQLVGCGPERLLDVVDHVVRTPALSFALLSRQIMRRLRVGSPQT